MKCLAGLLLSFALLFSTRSLAQEEPEQAVYEAEDIQLDDTHTRQGPFSLPDTLRTSMGLYLSIMPFTRQQAFGGGLGYPGILYQRSLSAGLSLTLAGLKVEPTFGYNIGEAKLLYLDISLFPQCKLIQWKRLEATLRLNTGYALSRLSDNSVKEKYWYDVWQ